MSFIEERESFLGERPPNLPQNTCTKLLHKPRENLRYQQHHVYMGHSDTFWFNMLLVLSYKHCKDKICEWGVWLVFVTDC